MNKTLRTILMVATLALCPSCAQMFMAKWPPTIDPLKGWNSWREYDEDSHPPVYGYHGTILVQRAQPAKHSRLDKAIKDDYQAFLKKHQAIPVSAPLFYEDGTGQHAVKVETEDYNDDVIFYIFIYDKSNTRVKLMSYYFGHMSC